MKAISNYMFCRYKQIIAVTMTTSVVFVVVIIASTCFNWQRLENDFSGYENIEKFDDSKSHNYFCAID